MHTPINKLIVKLEKKLYDTRTFESGQTIHFDPSWHPEEHAMLTATVVSVPPSVSSRQDYAGYQVTGIQPGDEILIRYDVVFSYYDQPDRDAPVYKNLLFQYNGETQRFEEFWLCDILQVFAIAKNNKWEMINGFVMLDIIEEHKSNFNNWLIRPDSYNNEQLKHLAKIISGGAGISLCPGDKVYINPQTVMQYQLNLKRFYIIKEQYILGFCK